MKWLHQTAQISCQKGRRKSCAKEACAKRVPFIVMLQKMIKVTTIGRQPLEDASRVSAQPRQGRQVHQFSPVGTIGCSQGREPLEPVALRRSSPRRGRQECRGVWSRVTQFNLIPH